MNKNKDIEKILLNDASYDEIIRTKVEQDFVQELDKSKSEKSGYITEISSAPKDRIFTKFATYEVINKISKTKSYINGVQAEGFLGNKTAEREKLLAGTIDSFVSGNIFVKFVKVKV